MPNLKIDINAVDTVADNIKLYNTQMRDSIIDVQASVTRLNNCCVSAAATVAMNKFNEIKSKFFDARYHVLDNYVNFLYQQVEKEYTRTEDMNVSLADQFK